MSPAPRIVNAVFLKSGDTVIVEEATYQGTLQRFNRLGVNYVAAPLNENVIRMDMLDQILSDLQRNGTAPKYFYTIPTEQNPTGSVMPEARRLEFLQRWLERTMSLSLKMAVMPI